MAAYQPNTFEDPDWQQAYELLDQPEADEAEEELDPVQDREYQRHMLKLAVTLEFGPDDLDANRSGHLSLAQIARFEGRMRRDYWIFLIVLSALAFVLGVIGINALPGGLFMLALSVAVMVFALGTASTLPGELRSLRDRPVQASSFRMGRLSLLLRRWGFNDEKTIPMVKQDFQMDTNRTIVASSNLYKVLRPNQDYRAYYTRLHRHFGRYRLVSMEPVGKWSADAPEEKAKRKRGKFKRSR